MASDGRSPPVFTIGATTAPWLMDSAALSRFGRRVYVPLPDPAARRSVLEIHLTRRGHSVDFPIDVLVERTAGLSGRQLAFVAAVAVENMVADCNPDLPQVVIGQGTPLKDYELKIRPLQWSDVEPVLAGVRPDTSPDELQRFASWSSGTKE
jgi:SpoVK/Ycf46/Vps4 family AAA+-type ATPase